MNKKIHFHLLEKQETFFHHTCRPPVSQKMIRIYCSTGAGKGKAAGRGGSSREPPAAGQNPPVKRAKTGIDTENDL